jgi:hypothetical protein
MATPQRRSRGTAGRLAPAAIAPAPFLPASGGYNFPA